MNTGIHNILDYGADPTGVRFSTSAVQGAIDTCGERGGGTVVVPPGSYPIGTVQLKGHVRLHLEPGSRLCGSGNLGDYRREGILRGMIFAEDAENIVLSGYGTIDGNGDHFMQWNRAHRGPDFDRRVTRQGEAYLAGETVTEDGPVAFDQRPGMQIVFLNCENVVISDLTLANSPSWTVRVGYCDDVRIRGVTIRNNRMIPNSDGVHVTSSRNVRISDCDIRAGDDAIIVTGFGDEVSTRSRKGSVASIERCRRGNKKPVAENVVVTNCVLCSRSSAVRVGYGPNPIRDCLFQNLVIRDSNRGLGVFARDPADIENLLFSDITVETRLHDGHWWGNGEPFHVSAVRRSEGSQTVGRIRNVRFRNIIAAGEAGAVLYGTRESVIEDLVFEDVRMVIRNGKHAGKTGGNFDLRPTADLELGVFLHDIPGLYAQYVDRLTLRDFEVVWGEEVADYHTYALEGYRLEDLLLDGFRGRPAHPDRDDAAVRLRKTANAVIRHCEGSIFEE